MLTDSTFLIPQATAGVYYGIVATDVDNDGMSEFVVAGHGTANRVLKWQYAALQDTTPLSMHDSDGLARGIAAGDIDGDGSEEIYIVNSEKTRGYKEQRDRLYVQKGGRWLDMLSMEQYTPVRNMYAAHSVLALDRLGTGRTGFLLATSGGPLRLYELNQRGVLRDSAPVAHLSRVVAGRGVLAFATPMGYSHTTMVLVTVEGGGNLLYQHRGDGVYRDVARTAGLRDRGEAGRGATRVSAGTNGLFSLVIGNVNGRHRLLVPQSNGQYRDEAPPALAAPSPVSNVVAADFDNDGYEEVFFNNFNAPNRLFRQTMGGWHEVPLSAGVAAANHPGMGAAVADIDDDGWLEMLLSGGGEPSPLMLLRTTRQPHNWVRVQPLTPHGAPARGALVMLRAGGRRQWRVIDGGSAFLCQMEPYAHFGLGLLDEVERVTITWTDGNIVTIDAPAINTTLRVPYPQRLRGD